MLTQIDWDEAFCAGREGAGVCKGDSGSGFYLNENGKFYLRGIVSSSVVRSCSEANLALYSDVFWYLDFIEKVENQFFKFPDIIQLNYHFLFKVYGTSQVDDGSGRYNTSKVYFPYYFRELFF